MLQGCKAKRECYLQKQVSWYVASVLSQVERYLFDDVADADAPTQMRGSRKSILVVDPQQVQVHVQK